ncbi:MAG: hypothetical protein IKP63_06180 [Paludibacteraceae bacterium]|nr:hypothetical protein [Paludibacteraceae bacterium]
MRKNYLILLFLAIACLGFTACSDDDKDSGSAPKSALDNISNNQININGHVYDFNANLAVRPAQGEDVGAHYLDITPKDVNKANDFLGRFDIGTPLMGVNINLADPLKAVGSNQLSVQITDGEWENTYYAMDCFEDYVMSRIEGTEYENSGFKEGSFIAKHDSNGFTLQMYGTLNNGMVIAIKAFVPESAVDYWD